jgi:hemolysin activation/secretion protein
MMALGISISANGQTAAQDLQSNREEIRRRQQAEQAEQESRLEQPRVDLQPRIVPTPEEIPDDPDGFPIDHVIVDTGGRNLPWLHELAKKSQGKKLGMAGIQHVIHYLSNACIERGYVTTRILLPEQDIAETQTLKLVAVMGIVGKIYVSGQSDTWGGTWWNAFPTHSGKMLNIRDVEQGLEQMKRVPTQDVTMELKPGAQSGQSDVVVTRKNQFPIRGHLGIDNSGDKNTGQWQGSATAMWDNPLFLNDLLAFTYNGAVATSSGQGTNGNNLTYSVPFDYWTLFGSYNAYDYSSNRSGLLQPL